MKNKAPHKYYNILTTEGTDEATILMYGYIGEEYDWGTGEMTGITDIEFVKELEAMAAKFPKINIRINSPGGEVFHGSAIVTAIRNCTSEVHTWIDGVAASMAGIIWMAGHKRHMAKNGMLMLHSASGICWGNAKEMRETADWMDQFDQTLIISAAEAVGMKEEEMKSKYFDYSDHWLTYNDVDAEGWISTPDDYKSEATLPTNLTAMKYRDLVAFFEDQEKNQHQKDTKGILAQFKAWLEETKAAIVGPNHTPSPSSITEDMTIEDFKASLSDGKLTLEEVQAHLDSLPPADPAAEEEEEAISALRAENATMQAQITDLVAKVKAFGALPGAGKSTPELPTNDLPGADGGEKTDAQMLEESNSALSAAAASGDAVMFTAAAPKR